MTLAIQLPPREDQQVFNLHVWRRMLDNPELAKIEGRFETDRHGHILRSPRFRGTGVQCAEAWSAAPLITSGTTGELRSFAVAVTLRW